MSGNNRGDRSALQKIQVACRTCGVSDSFYSNLSVEKFKARHRGHDVVGGAAEERPVQAPVMDAAPNEDKSFEREMLAKSGGIGPEMKASLEREVVTKKSLEREAGTRIPRVVVDLVTFPALRDSVFRVRGFKEDLEEAFVATSRFEHGAEVRGMLASGEYVDYDFSGLRYIWEPEAIEFEGDARERLGMQPNIEIEKEAPMVESEPEQGESLPELDDSVARTNETLFGSPRGLETDLESAPVDSSPSPFSSPEPVETFDVPAPTSPPLPTEVKGPEDATSVSELALAESPAMMQPPPAKPNEESKTAPDEAPAPPQDEDDYLLVSKSWYIQGGEMNKREAVRLSKVLKAFRYKVEPLYTIGVILDDILSIETSKNEISRTLIERVEDAGYRLTAVTTDQGKPVAWFKKKEPTLAAPRSLTSGQLTKRNDDLHAQVEDNLPPSQPPALDEAKTKLSRDSGLTDLEAELASDLVT